MARGARKLRIQPDVAFLTSSQDLGHATSNLGSLGCKVSGWTLQSRAFSVLSCLGFMLLADLKLPPASPFVSASVCYYLFLLGYTSVITLVMIIARKVFVKHHLRRTFSVEWAFMCHRDRKEG